MSSARPRTPKEEEEDGLNTTELKQQLKVHLGKLSRDIKKTQVTAAQVTSPEEFRSIIDGLNAEIQALKETNEELASQASVNELLRRTPAKGVPSSAKKGGGRSAADVRPMPPLPGDDSDNDE